MWELLKIFKMLISSKIQIKINYDHNQIELLSLFY